MTPTPESYFDEMWATGPDPWDHGGRFYEHRKYALTAAMLRSARYESVFEPGCATGLLTVLIAPRADRHLATDRHPRAVEVTRERVAGIDGVRVEVGEIPGDWPDEQFEAIVLSEVLYYLEPADVADALDRAAASTSAGGELVAVHYREPVAEHTLLGDQVHEIVNDHAAWERAVTHLEELFVLESFTRR
jgi:SAM-dependent methyltransferase